MITQSEIKSVIDYDAEKGLFVWINPSKYHAEKKLTPSGCVNSNYLIIKICGKGYKAHRLAWLYVYGYMPSLIDHINGDSLDNRIANLREATQFQNAQNHGRVGGGVRELPSGRFQARIAANNVSKSLGTFPNKEAAQEAYLKGRREQHDAPRLGV